MDYPLYWMSVDRRMSRFANPLATRQSSDAYTVPYIPFIKYLQPNNANLLIFFNFFFLFVFFFYFYFCCALIHFSALLKTYLFGFYFNHISVRAFFTFVLFVSLALTSWIVAWIYGDCLNFCCLFTSKLWLHFNNIHWIVVRYISNQRHSNEAQKRQIANTNTVWCMEKWKKERKKRKKKMKNNEVEDGKCSLNSRQVKWAGRTESSQKKYVPVKVCTFHLIRGIFASLYPIFDLNLNWCSCVYD